MTCSISGLGISGGTKIRCLLLTQSPHDRRDRAGPVVQIIPGLVSAILGWVVAFLIVHWALLGERALDRLLPPGETTRLARDESWRISIVDAGDDLARTRQESTPTTWRDLIEVTQREGFAAGDAGERHRLTVAELNAALGSNVVFCLTDRGGRRRVGDLRVVGIEGEGEGSFLVLSGEELRDPPGAA